MKLAHRTLMKVSLGIASLLAAAAAPASAGGGRPGNVTTIAGFGYIDHTGNDPNLVSPGLITTDGSGYAYFADTGNSIVYGRDPWNLIDRIAGSGLPGFSGDGGPALQARLNHPAAAATTAASFAIDNNAAIYIADTGNHRIRAVQIRKTTRTNPDGSSSVVQQQIITTFAGDGTATDKGDGGPALQAGFVSPEGILVGPDNSLYVADRLAHRVRRIGSDGAITTIAGTGQAGFSGDGGPAKLAQLNQPVGLLFDVAGDLFISDSLNDRVRIVTPDGKIATYVGGGSHPEDGASGPSASIHRPLGLAINPAGYLFFSDGLRVRALIDGVVHTVAGSGRAGWTGDEDDPLKATFRHPIGLGVPKEEELLIDDDVQRRFRILTGLTSSDTVETRLGNELYDDTLATSAKLTLPQAVAPAADGRALIADFGNRRIRSLQSSTDPTQPATPYYLYTVAGGGAEPPADQKNAATVDTGPTTGVAGRVGGAYYFSEGAHVWQVDPAGLLHAVAIPGLVSPMGLALAPDGRLFVADAGASRVWVVDPAGHAAAFAGSVAGDGGDGGPALLARLNGPVAVSVAPNGTVYIADTANHKVKRVDPSGTIVTVAGTGSAGYAEKGPATATPLDAPEGVAVDSDGTLYVADTGNNRIARVTAAGALEAVSGHPDPGLPQRNELTGDDLEEWSGATGWCQPTGMAFDGNGNLYVADRGNHRIRTVWSASAARLGPDPSIQPGDLNGDGKVNVQDVVLALQIAVKAITPTPDQSTLADVAPRPGAAGRPYGDGKVDASDAVMILKRALGFIADADWP